TLPRLFLQHLYRAALRPLLRLAENTENVADTAEQTIRQCRVRLALVVYENHANGFVHSAGLVGDLHRLRDDVSKLDRLAHVVGNRFSIGEGLIHGYSGLEVFTLEGGEHSHIASVHAREL